MRRSPSGLPAPGIQCQTRLACSDRGTTQAVYYRDPRGIEPVDEFIQALPPKRAAKIDNFVEEHLNSPPGPQMGRTCSARGPLGPGVTVYSTRWLSWRLR